MLERLNECVPSPAVPSPTALTLSLPESSLTESLESTRSSKRQLELRIQTLESEAASAASAAAAAPATAGAGGSGDELELQELRDQIADLEDELEDARKREQKTRSSLLEVRSFQFSSLRVERDC